MQGLRKAACRARTPRVRQDADVGLRTGRGLAPTWRPGSALHQVLQEGVRFARERQVTGDIGLGGAAGQ